MYYQTIFRHRHWFINLFFLILVLAISYFFIFFIIPKILPEGQICNTKKQGIIFRNEVWKGEIRITGDVWAFPGSKIEIMPGAKILISKDDHFNLHFFPWDLRSGLNTDKESFGVRNGELFRDERNRIQLNFAKLYAIGTKEMPIEISPFDSNSQSPYDFNGLSVGEGVLAFVKISNYRKLTIGDKVTVRDSEFSNSGDCAICLEYDSPTIANNVFNKNLRSYIRLVGGSPKINDNLFLPSKGEGIVVEPKRFGSPIIYHNSFEMPNQVALRFISGAEEKGGIVAFNDFAGSNRILIPCDSKVDFIQNEMHGLIEFSKSGNCIGTFTMGPNFWFSKDRNAIIKEKFIGKESGFEIVLPVVLSSSPSDVGKRK
jgi:hypothetical protein